MEELPEVTLFITAYNEEQVVEKKMQNCRELDYPKEKFQIVWVTDGSCDATNKKLKAYPDATVYYSAERKNCSHEPRNKICHYSDCDFYGCQYFY